MKKVICILLAVLLACGMLASCSDSGVNSGSETDGSAPAAVEEGDAPAPETAPETEEALPAPEVRDLSGAVLTIMNMTPASFNWADTRMFAEETNGEILNDALYNREQKVEELYNCSLEELLTQHNSGGDMAKGVKAGDMSATPRWCSTRPCPAC